MTDQHSYSNRLAELNQDANLNNLTTVIPRQLSKPSKDRLVAQIQEVLPLNYNFLTHRLELKGQPVDGDFLGSLHLHLAEEFSLNVGKQDAIDAAIIVARRRHYHPVRDYLNSLYSGLPPQVWNRLAWHCFGLDDPIATLHLQRQLIGLVARALRPGCELHTCLVIHSDRQGVGKSQFWKVLGGEWFSDSLGDLQNLKDDLLTLHSAWLHEWGEIDRVLGKRESEAMKRFLSASQDDIRKPYGRSVERLPRSCGIVGTTNRRDFIKDFTGNRRFPIISIQQVNLEWVQAHRHKIWCSAFDAFGLGVPWHYSAEEIDLINQTARSFAATDPLLERLETVLEEHSEPTEVPVAQALVWMGRGDERRETQLCRAIARGFQSLGWQPTATRRRYSLSDGSTTDKTTGWLRPED
jgi:predicted P-loop ATPase